MENGVWLVICGMGPGQGPGVFRIEAGCYEIGRSKNCHIRYFHSSVSRRHAMLAMLDSQLCVRDLASRNGTFVDGQPVQSAQLGPGSSLRVGHVTLEVTERLWSERYPTDVADRTDLAAVCDDADAWVRASGFGPQRKQVLALLLDGLAEKQIAARLHIRERTIHWHVEEIYQALDVHSRGELSAYFRNTEAVLAACTAPH